MKHNNSTKTTNEINCNNNIYQNKVTLKEVQMKQIVTSTPLGPCVLSVDWRAGKVLRLKKIAST
ncbi:hypothetical protein HanPSC8_Chr10g0410051 [Helianthus annuus]|nr:hypothetical protein HanPSC8_Chr10g0410051 [Helianthus annuus]